jgi:hypothetical protein
MIVVGFSIFAWSIFSSFSDMGRELSQVVVPGSADLDLKEPGEYTVFYENQTYVNGKFYSTGEQIPGLQIQVSEKATGRELSTYPTPGGFTYSFGGRSGRSIMTFRVERSGIYQINASYPSGKGPEVVLAMGHGFAESIFSSVAIALAALFGSMVMAAVVVFVTYTRRKKALDQQREEERLMKGGF